MAIELKRAAFVPCNLCLRVIYLEQFNTVNDNEYSLKKVFILAGLSNLLLAAAANSNENGLICGSILKYDVVC